MNIISVLLCILLLSSATYLLIFPQRLFFNNIFKKELIDDDNDQNDDIVINGKSAQNFNQYKITSEQCAKHASKASKIENEEDWKNSVYNKWKMGSIKSCELGRQGNVGSCCFCKGDWPTGGGMRYEEVANTCCYGSYCKMDKAECRVYSELNYDDRNHCKWCTLIYGGSIYGRCECGQRIVGGMTTPADDARAIKPSSCS